MLIVHVFQLWPPAVNDIKQLHVHVHVCGLVVVLTTDMTVLHSILLTLLTLLCFRLIMKFATTNFTD